MWTRTFDEIIRTLRRAAVPLPLMRLGGAQALAVVPALLPSLRGAASADAVAAGREPAAEAACRGGPSGRVEIYSRFELARCRAWKRAFANQRKDRRYYEVVEDTIHQGFDYRYFVVKDRSGEIVAVQPFFILDQDLLAGVSRTIRAPVDGIRRLWPRFLMMRTLMVGCAAGEGHVDGPDEAAACNTARILAAAVRAHAHRLKVKLIVLKEFPAVYRRALDCFRAAGFARVPSLPMVRLNIEYRNFDDYMDKALSANMRRNLRKKFKAAARAPAIAMSLLDDIAPVVDDVYRLYLQVFERSKLQFEKLTKEYFCSLGRRMPDKMRFFVWRQNGSIVAFAMCMVHRNTIYFEYLGLDYRISLDVHLYHYVIRDLLNWAMAKGYKWCASTAVNYDPKYHLRFRLDPLDLYVRHTSSALNLVLKLLLPWVEPTRYDKTLKQFPNYAELWDDAPKSEEPVRLDLAA